MPETSATDQSNRYGIIAAIASMAIVSFSVGLMSPLVTLFLKAKDFNYALIGIIAAMPAVGAIILAPWLSTIFRYLGGFRTIYLSVLLGAISIALLPLTENYGLWLFLRFFQGMGFGLLFIVSDTWINQMVDPEKRGRVIGIYMAISTVSIALGVCSISIFNISTYYPFLVGALTFAFALVPVLYLKNILLVIGDWPAFDVFRGIAREPQLCIVVFLYSALNTIALSLLPLFAMYRGYTLNQSVYIFAALIAGSFMMQPLIGWLADLLNRYRLLLICVGGTLVTLILLWMLPHGSIWIWPITFILGSFVGGLITLVLTIVGQRFKGTQLIKFNTTISLVVNIAYLITPILGGFIMDIWNPDSLPILFVILTLIVLTILKFSGTSFRRIVEQKVSLQ